MADSRIHQLIVLIVINTLIITALTASITVENASYDSPVDTVKAQKTSEIPSRSGSRWDVGPDTWAMFRYNASKWGFTPGEKGPDTNNVLWTFNTTNSNTGNGVYSSPAIVNGKVYIGSGGGKLFCLDLYTGAHYWNYSTGPFHGMACSPAVVNNKVFFGNDFVPQLFCLDATSGKKLWNFTIGGGLMRGIYSSPTVTGGRVYFGTDKWNDNDDRIYCLPENDPDGDGNITMSEIIWKFDAPDKVWSSPAVVGDKVYIGMGDANNAGNNKFYCLYASNGSVAWTYPKTGNVKDVLSAPAVVDGKVYFGAKDKNVYCLYASNGTKIWEYTTGAEIWSSPALAYGRVFIGSTDDKLYCLNATTGQKIWDYTTGDVILSSPTVADRKVYVGSADGKVYCFNATVNTAQKRWEYFISTDNYGICSSPSIADGKLVVGGVDQDIPRIWCFGDVDTKPPKIKSTYPVDQSENIPTALTITIDFDEAMDTSTLTTSNIILKDSLSNPVSGTIQYLYSMRSALFTPDGRLLRGEDYTVTVLSAVSDASGLSLDGNKNGVSDGSPADDYIWKFKTSKNILPVLSDANITAVEALNLNTVFNFTVTYTDLDNDTPELNPAYIRIFIDGEAVGRAMNLDLNASPALRDGIYNNSERYTYSMQFSTYGQHTYQFKCFDGININATPVFNAPLIWFPPVMNTISNQTAVEDIDLVLDLSDKIIDEDTPRSSLVLSENSSYAEVDGLNITFNYPNEFNYPSGRTYEIVEILLNDTVSNFEVKQDIRVDVTAVNDAPVMAHISNLTVYEDEAYILDMEPHLSDVDNNMSELTIDTNASWAAIDNAAKEIAFLYPENSGIRTEIVNISVFDGEFYDYQIITINVIQTGLPFDLLYIRDEVAVEDIDLVINISNFVKPNWASFDEIKLEINSSYGRIENTSMIFNYPNSFNYPSGRTHEIVRFTASYQNITMSRDFKIEVTPVNDGPVLKVIYAPSMALEDTKVSFSVLHNDVDGSENPTVEVIIDDEAYTMTYISGDIHTEGGLYEVELELSLGDYEYYFRTNDMEQSNNSIDESVTYYLSVIEYFEGGNDTDGDGMPDTWELKYGFDPSDPSDADDDPDEDTYTNLEEYLGVDGKPGGNDSSNPLDSSDIPVKSDIDDDDDDDGDKSEGVPSEKETSNFFWLALIIIVIIVIVLFAFLFMKKKSKKVEEAEETRVVSPDAAVTPEPLEAGPPPIPQVEPAPEQAAPMAVPVAGQPPTDLKGSAPATPMPAPAVPAELPAPEPSEAELPEQPEVAPEAEPMPAEAEASEMELPEEPLQEPPSEPTQPPEPPQEPAPEPEIQMTKPVEKDPKTPDQTD
ncbi:MAG: PQQ-binding-like beta-propeller repeat protein [Thermoplasmata archaeon]|nr:MAG: PQQ-binding-like beta-propeller repeat protein [Thermoplasmata archaeon]